MMLIGVSSFGQREQMSHTQLVDFLNTNTQSKVWIVDSVLFFDHSKMEIKTLDSIDPLPRVYKDQHVGKPFRKTEPQETAQDEILMENDTVVVIRRRKIKKQSLLFARSQNKDTIDHRFDVTRIDLRKKIAITANATSKQKTRVQLRLLEEDAGQIHTLLFADSDNKKIASAIFTLKKYQQSAKKK